MNESAPTNSGSQDSRNVQPLRDDGMNFHTWVCMLVMFSLVIARFLPPGDGTARVLAYAAIVVSVGYFVKYLVMRAWLGSLLPLFLAVMASQVLWPNWLFNPEPRVMSFVEVQSAFNACRAKGASPIPIYDKDDPIRVYQVQCTQ